MHNFSHMPNLLRSFLNCVTGEKYTVPCICHMHSSFSGQEYNLEVELRIQVLFALHYSSDT